MVGNTVKLQQPMVPSPTPSKWKIVAMTSKPVRSCYLLAEKILKMQIQRFFLFVSSLMAQSRRKNKENKNWRRVTVMLPLNKQFKRRNSNSRKLALEVKITVHAQSFSFTDVWKCICQKFWKKSLPLTIGWQKTFIFFVLNQK